MVNVAANNGNTALHAAANSGHVDSVVELIKCKDININMCNPLCDNATPLHLAVMHGQYPKNHIFTNVSNSLSSLSSL